MMRELPVVAFLSIVRHAGEYALVELRMQGDELVSRDIIEQSHQFGAVWDAFKEAAATRYGKKVKHEDLS